MENIIDCLKKTSALFPNKTAIACRNEKYSFSQLDELASRLGRTIANLSTNDSPVGVIVHRDADTLLYFLAVAYSGRFYVPIDPEIPSEKLKSIIENADLSIVFGSENDRSLLEKAEFVGKKISKSDASDERCVSPDIDSDSPLYMIYTSGSTGKPKGVLKSHGAVMSFIKAFVSEFDFDENEIIGNQTPFFFDAAAKDIYLMLYTGATLEILPSELFIFPVTLIEYLNEKHISYTCWVPTAYALVTQMNTFKKIKPAYLKKAFFVGEVFPVKQLKKWLEELPEIKYVNLFGSTEIAGVSCFYVLPAVDELPEILPIGKALNNCTVYLCGDDGIITESNKTGEVYVSSDALALGYYKDEPKTAEVFLNCTLPEGSWARVLKTGDLARYDDLGNLVFVSRKDYQIKHMGRRIELGEIEAAADSLSQVQRCCCLYNDEKKRIELFCTLFDSNFSPQEIQNELKKRLSQYMVPSKIHVLEEMPYNANGKIDRTALKERM